MKANRPNLLVVTIAGLALLASKAQGQDQANDAAWQRYLHILQTSTLEWRTSEPFLLRIDYQLYDLAGNPIEKGDAEESWTATGGKKIRIQSPSLSVGDSSSDDAFKTHTRESYLVRQAINALVRPFPTTTTYKDFAADEFKQIRADSELNCFSLVRPGERRSANTPAYCTDVNNHLVAMAGPLYLIERRDFRKYRGHEIPNEMLLTYEGKPALSVHVAELDEISPSSTSASNAKKTLPPSRVAGELLAVRILKKKDPQYPKEAKKKHITGSVLVTAIITKQGTIAGMDVIASPDPLLTQSVKDAVKTWTYQPYLLNGIPTEIDTTITVDYAIGGH